MSESKMEPYNYGMGEMMKSWKVLLEQVLERDTIDNYLFENCVEWSEADTQYRMVMYQYPLAAAMLIGEMELARQLYEKGYEWKDTPTMDAMELKMFPGGVIHSMDNSFLFQLVILRCLEQLTLAENIWVREFFTSTFINKLDAKLIENLASNIPLFCCALQEEDTKKQWELQERYLNLVEELLPKVYHKAMMDSKFRENMCKAKSPHPSWYIVPLKRWLQYSKDVNRAGYKEHQNTLCELVQSYKQLFTAKEREQLLMLAGVHSE